MISYPMHFKQYGYFLRMHIYNTAYRCDISRNAKEMWSFDLLSVAIEKLKEKM